MKQRILAWGPVLCWMGVIFFFSSLRKTFVVSDSYTLSFFFYKILHLIEYAFLYTLLARALAMSGISGKRRWLWGFVILMLYASSDEIHQLFVPTREGTVRDVIIDTVGGGIGWIFLNGILPRLPGKLRNLAKKLAVSGKSVSTKKAPRG